MSNEVISNLALISNELIKIEKLQSTEFVVKDEMLAESLSEEGQRKYLLLLLACYIIVIC